MATKQKQKRSPVSVGLMSVKPKRTVWLMLWQHGFGTDTGVFTTPDKAYQAIKRLMEQYLEDCISVEALQAEMRDLLKANKVVEAIQFWEMNTTETFEIRELPLQ